MDDLISRQMLLEYIHGEPVGRLLCDKYNLDGLIKQFPSAQPYTDEEIRGIQELEQAQFEKMYELGYQAGRMAQPEQRWIPCSERLPEHGGRYLISVLDGINRRTTVAPYLPRCKAWAMNGRMAYWKVIAWLPLPEPYKGDDK